jgi:hypothetical protein
MSRRKSLVFSEAPRLPGPLLLAERSPFELFAGPEFDGCQSKREGPSVVMARLECIKIPQTVCALVLFACG